MQESRIMSGINFEIKKEDNEGLARAGIIKTPHGAIETPSFVTVGTLASVRTLTPDEIRSAGSQVVLANTYHLYLEGRHEVIKKAGGLAKFMNWNGPTMTDSGGFQIMSLAKTAGNVVVERNLRIVPSEHMADEMIQDGDSIEIIRLVGGG